MWGALRSSLMLGEMTILKKCISAVAKVPINSKFFFQDAWPLFAIGDHELFHFGTHRVFVLQLSASLQTGFQDICCLTLHQSFLPCLLQLSKSCPCCVPGCLWLSTELPLLSRQAVTLTDLAAAVELAQKANLWWARPCRRSRENNTLNDGTWLRIPEASAWFTEQ